MAALHRLGRTIVRWLRAVFGRTPPVSGGPVGTAGFEEFFGSRGVTSDDD